MGKIPINAAKLIFDNIPNREDRKSLVQACRNYNTIKNEINAFSKDNWENGSFYKLIDFFFDGIYKNTYKVTHIGFDIECFGHLYSAYYSKSKEDDPAGNKHVFLELLKYKLDETGDHITVRYEKTWEYIDRIEIRYAKPVEPIMVSIIRDVEGDDIFKPYTEEDLISFCTAESNVDFIHLRSLYDGNRPTYLEFVKLFNKINETLPPVTLGGVPTGAGGAPIVTLPTELLGDPKISKSALQRVYKDYNRYYVQDNESFKAEIKQRIENLHALPGLPPGLPGGRKDVNKNKDVKQHKDVKPKMSQDKVIVKGKTRTVYIGSRGAKMIKLNGEWVLLSSMRGKYTNLK